MVHKAIALASLLFAILFASGCKKGSVPDDIQGKWISTNFLTGTTSIKFSDGEVEQNGKIYDAQFRSDKDGIIIEVNDGGKIQKTRIRVLSPNELDIGGQTFHRSNQ